MLLKKNAFLFNFLILLGFTISYIADSLASKQENSYTLENSIIHTREESSVANILNDANDDAFSVGGVNNDTETTSYHNAKIIALNKITSKSQELSFKIGEAKYFGNIEIKIHKCIKNHNPYTPYSGILLTVIENKTDEDPITIFQGWMISSNISISTLEHPIYEIFAKDCF